MKKLHFNSKHTDEELLSIMREYAENVKFPTSRDFVASNNLPCARTYIDRFGSFQKAIIEAGIEIPKNKLQYFNREVFDDKTLLEKLKIEVLEKGSLLTAKEVDKNKNLPNELVYNRRFGGLPKAYNLLGLESLNKDKLQAELLDKFIELSKLINRTPTSRDLDEYSKKGFCHSAKTYSHHFGGIDNVQKLCNLIPTVPARNKTKEEMIEDLKKIATELGRPPTQTDLINFPLFASARTYLEKFGGFVNALKEAGFESNKYKVYYTKSGTPCFSRMEHLFAQMLDKYNFIYKKDVRYSEYISEVEKKITCDFVVKIDHKVYFVEIFGIEGNEKYELMKQYKINLCAENEVPLIQLSLNDFWNKKQKDIYNNFISSIKQVI